LIEIKIDRPIIEIINIVGSKKKTKSMEGKRKIKIEYKINMKNIIKIAKKTSIIAIKK